MSPSVPLVEDRLRHVVASLESLHRLATFTSQPHEITLFEDLATFANTVLSFAGAVRLHVDAVTRALSPSCQAIEAPGPTAPVASMPSRTVYLQGDDRDIFERLDTHAAAFGALATALAHYISDLRHSDDFMLFSMATLVRSQGQSTLQIADEIDAVAKRIQEQATAGLLKAFQREFDTQHPPSPTSDEKGGAR